MHDGVMHWEPKQTLASNPSVPDPTLSLSAAPFGQQQSTKIKPKVDDEAEHRRKLSGFLASHKNADAVQDSLVKHRKDQVAEEKKSEHKMETDSATQTGNQHRNRLGSYVSGLYQTPPNVLRNVLNQAKQMTSPASKLSAANEPAFLHQDAQIPNQM